MHYWSRAHIQQRWWGYFKKRQITVSCGLKKRSEVMVDVNRELLPESTEISPELVNPRAPPLLRLCA